jgi:hypothetical protein
VIAFRLWFIRDEKLVSPYREIVWSSPTIRAECPYSCYTHRAPDPSCSCGIYAWSKCLGERSVPADSRLVWGAVALFGRILKHEDELRAEKARLEALACHPIVDRRASIADPDALESWREVERVAERFRVPLVRLSALRALGAFGA